MLKKNYIRSLIIFTLLFWVFIFIRFYWNSYKNNNPLQLQKALQEDVFNKTSQIEKAIGIGYTSNFSKLLPKDVYYFLYQKEELIDWNTHFVLPKYQHVSENKYQIITLFNSRYLIKSQKIDSNRKLVFLVPICISYNIENEYLQSHFVANKYIPVTTILQEKYKKGGFALKDNHQNVIAYANFNPKEIKKIVPNYLDIILVIVAVFLLYASINISNIGLSRKKHQWKGFLFSVFIISFFRLLLYIFGIPFNARQLDFFSPLIYHKDAILYSLGDVFFNALGFMWIVSYVYKYTDYTIAFKQLQHKYLKALALLLSVAFSVYIFYQAIFITHSLITDANISFDVSNIKNITVLNFSGLVIMCLISGGVALTLNLTNYLINNLNSNKFLKYLLIGLFLLLFRGVLPVALSLATVFCISLWLVLFYILLDYIKIKITTDVSELSTIFWLLYVCISFTVLLLYFTNQREQLNKIRIVKELSVFQGVNKDASLRKTDSLIAIGRKTSSIAINNYTSTRINSESLFPELLTTNSFNVFHKYQNYAIAKYINGKLYYQKGDFQFPLFLRHTLPHKQNHSFFKRNNSLWSYYPLPNHAALVIVQEGISWLDGVIIFSYLFGISIIIILFIILYRLYASLFVLKEYKSHLIVFNFRKKTHYAMLSLVLVSFLILGTVTISFLFLRFEQNNNNNLSSTAQKFKEPIQEYIFNKHLYAVDSSVIDSIKLQDLLTTINPNTHADVNIFDLSGKLLSTSNMQLFNQGIVAPILSRDAMRLLSVNATSILCLDDKIGLLHFKVAYMNLYDELGNTIAYVSMPIYTSEKEIRYQITYLIIAMTNLYAFIFVLSTLLAFVVTNGLTSSFNLIIKQFQRVNLQKNETLEWPYDDDIGLMVAEYNKMVKKLEESAHQLAQTEREDAWKEMAKQVAHEIKNPLTPMRLNLQFLQNAIKNKQDNTLEITRKVTDSLIEQIDNLNYIASEFSNFAKLPDPQIAVFSLNTILESSVSIYKNESTITISLSLPPRPIIIKSDKSHLLRVFSNLLQNAVQSIPEGKEGLIQVNLYTQNQLAVVQVKDNGSGIPSSIREDVFIPHFTTKNAGSGIGLAMTKRIVEYWHGSIWFESIENEGTDFYVALPFLDDTIA